MEIHQARKHINNAYISAIICAGITFVVILVNLISGIQTPTISAWAMLDVALILGLAYGIYKSSRTCAVIMLVYYIGAKIYMMMETGIIPGVIAWVFIYYFFQGVRGTFAYHQLMNQKHSPNQY